MHRKGGAFPSSGKSSDCESLDVRTPSPEHNGNLESPPGCGVSAVDAGMCAESWLVAVGCCCWLPAAKDVAFCGSNVARGGSATAGFPLGALHMMVLRVLQVQRGYVQFVWQLAKMLFFLWVKHLPEFPADALRVHLKSLVVKCISNRW